jgi:hypothetical protein
LRRFPHEEQTQHKTRRCRPMAVMAMSVARIRFIKSTSVAVG